MKLLPHEYVRLKKLIKLGEEVRHSDGCKYCSEYSRDKTLICSSCTDTLRMCSNAEKAKLIEDIKEAGGEALANSIQRVFNCPSLKSVEADRKLKQKQNREKGKRLDQHTKDLLIQHLALGWSYSRLSEKFDVSKTTLSRLKNKALERHVPFSPMSHSN